MIVFPAAVAGLIVARTSKIKSDGLVALSATNCQATVEDQLGSPRGLTIFGLVVVVRPGNIYVPKAFVNIS